MVGMVMQGGARTGDGYFGFVNELSIDMLS